MFPLFLATDIYLITLNLSFKCSAIILSKKGTNFLQHIPSSLLNYLNISYQLMQRKTFLVRGNEIHCHKPFAKGNLCVLKDSTNSTRKVLVTSRTMKSSTFEHLIMKLATIRTSHILCIILTPSALNDCSLTNLIS